MNDMSKSIAPKSDQLNADDLIAGPKTITVTGVRIAAGEQPVSISYEGDGGKPWKPCKSMCRVLVSVWGLKPDNYVGKALTLYRDPDVRYGGIAVGGIRISHMSDIDASHTMALTITRANRKPFTVRPLASTSNQQMTDSNSPPAPLAPADGDQTGAPDTSPSDGAPVALFTLVDPKGETRTTPDVAVWRDTLIKLLTTKPFDTAQRLWLDNKAHVESARAHKPDDAIKVEAEWVRRERAASDTARGG